MNKYKYPRTPHLPWSPGKSSDDVVIKSLKLLESADSVVVTEKMDGENTTIYPDGSCHARSLDSTNHPSRTWMKRFAASWSGSFKYHRICGENLYAQHSITYKDLESYFYAFAAWNDENDCLSWKNTIKLLDMVSIVHVPVIYEGKFNAVNIDNAFRAYCANKPIGQEVEGYVVRSTNQFHLSRFDSLVAKYVSASHVQTDEHWMYKSVVKNQLISVK